MSSCALHGASVLLTCSHLTVPVSLRPPPSGFWTTFALSADAVMERPPVSSPSVPTAPSPALNRRCCFPGAQAQRAARTSQTERERPQSTSLLGSPGAWHTTRVPSAAAPSAPQQLTPWSYFTVFIYQLTDSLFLLFLTKPVLNILCMLRAGNNEKTILCFNE